MLRAARITGAVTVAFLVAMGCGSNDDRSPREQCLAAQEEANARAQECSPMTGTIGFSCQNFGTGESCGVIADYFDCLSFVTCDQGSVVIPSDCTLGACE